MHQHVTRGNDGTTVDIPAVTEGREHWQLQQPLMHHSPAVTHHCISGEVHHQDTAARHRVRILVLSICFKMTDLPWCKP